VSEGKPSESLVDRRLEAERRTIATDGDYKKQKQNKKAENKTSRYTTVQGRATIVVIAGSLDLFSKVIDRDLVTRFMKCKWRSVLEMPVQGTTLPGHALDHHADGHSTWERGKKLG
jgi:hypothetical protein